MGRKMAKKNGKKWEKRHFGRLINIMYIFYIFYNIIYMHIYTYFFQHLSRVNAESAFSYVKVFPMSFPCIFPLFRSHFQTSS